MIGDSPAMSEVFEQIAVVAGTDASVLLIGETGTGKELIARALHDRSARKERLMVSVNCAALPSELIESELFGHEKGAFTGATAQRKGRFELADNGSIFLDEVGELTAQAQAKLLRILQQQSFERVGGSTTLHVNARVIAATNRDLAGNGEGRPLPRRPLLPAQCLSDPGAAAARAALRHPAAGAAFPASEWPASSTSRCRASSRIHWND